MNLQKYFQNYASLKDQTRFGRVALVVVSLIALGELALVAMRPTVVTVVPWTLTREAQITQASASQSYIEAWGLALAELLGNVTPSSANFVADRLKPLLSPDIYSSVMDAVHAGAQRLTEDRISVRFEPRQVKFERSTGKVFVSGFSFTRAGTSMDTEVREQRTFEFILKIDHYAPVVTHINSYVGPARTVDVANREQARSESRAKNQQEAAARRAKALSRQADLSADGGDAAEKIAP